MTALVGCVLAYALLVPGTAGLGNVGVGASGMAMGGEAACDAGAAAAETCALAELVAQGNPAHAEALVYANPVEVNCPVAATGDLALAFGGCDLPSFDFRYRVSRFADSERPSGVVRPQRDRTLVRSSVIAPGAPPSRGSPVPLAAPPMAVYALTTLPPPREARLAGAPVARMTTRVVAPLDRPPRA